MDGKGHGCSDPRSFHPLIVIESTPFWSPVDEIFINDKPAALAYQFCPLIVMDQLPAAALRTDRLCMILGLLFVFFHTLLQTVFESFPLILKNF
jgi:hypothetical protein